MKGANKSSLESYLGPIDGLHSLNVVISKYWIIAVDFPDTWKMKVQILIEKVLLEQNKQMWPIIESIFYFEIVKCYH